MALNTIIAQLQAPAALPQILAPPGPVAFGPNNIIPDGTVKAEHDYFKAIKKMKAVGGNAVVTDADYVAAAKRKTAIDFAATEQTYPNAVAPAWAIGLIAQVNQMSAQLNQLTVAQNQITAQLNQLTVAENQTTAQLNQLTGQVNQMVVQLNRTEAKADQAPLRAANHLTYSTGSNLLALHPLPTTVAANVGLFPQAVGVFFPLTLTAAEGLTLAELAALSNFYGVVFQGGVLAQRQQFRKFIGGGD